MPRTGPSYVGGNKNNDKIKQFLIVLGTTVSILHMLNHLNAVR